MLGALRHLDAQRRVKLPLTSALCVGVALLLLGYVAGLGNTRTVRKIYFSTDRAARLILRENSCLRKSAPARPRSHSAPSSPARRPSRWPTRPTR